MSGPRLGNPCRQGAAEDHLGTWWFGYRHARDIPDELFLEAMQIAARERAEVQGWSRPLPANRWDIGAVLATGHIADFDAETPGVPPKVVLAKAKRLIARGVIRGCDCGCRGDFELT